tara:strand:+ start:9980 stop:10525 length:546 start_codon:yes stop_codon:yes gene_type:complete
MPCATKKRNDGTKYVICYKDKDDTKKKKATAKKAKAATKIQAVARGKKQRKVALAKVKKPTGPKVKAAVEKIEIKKPKRGQVIIAHSGDHTGFLGIVKSIDGDNLRLTKGFAVQRPYPPTHTPADRWWRTSKEKEKTVKWTPNEDKQLTRDNQERNRRFLKVIKRDKIDYNDKTQRWNRKK